VQAMAGDGAFLREIDEIRHAGGEYAAAMARGEFARVLRVTGDLEGALRHGGRAIADLTRLGVQGSIGPARLEEAAALLAVGDFDGAEQSVRAGLSISTTPAATDGDRRKAAAVEFLVALASGYTPRPTSALARALPPVGSPHGAADEAIPFLAEGLLVAASDDAREVVAGLHGVRDRIPRSSRLVPRVLLAAVRRILGVAGERGDDDAIAAAATSGFIQSHHLVAHVATLWAESIRMERAGAAEAADVSRAAAIGRAAAAGHVGLVEAVLAGARRC